MARLAHATIYGYDPYDNDDDQDRGSPDLGGDPATATRQDDEARDTAASPSSSSVGGNAPTQPRLPGTGDEDHGDAVPAGLNRAQRRAQRRTPNRNGHARPTRQPNPFHLGLLRLDLTALRRGYTIDGEACELAGTGPIPVAVATQLLGQATIKLVISDNNGGVVHVTHIGNGKPAAEGLGALPGGTSMPERRPGPSTHLALVHIAANELRAHSPETLPGSELCTVAGVGPVSTAATRRMLHPWLLKLVLRRGVAVAGYIHRGRKATVAQRMALLWTQPECTVEGCPHSFVEIDHRLDWAKTHVTRLEALDRLCHHHHSQKTLQGWALVAGTGKRPMVQPSDPQHPLTQAA